MRKDFQKGIANPIKKDKKMFNQGILIQSLIEQVGKILAVLLKDIDYLYRVNGINYEIHHFYMTIFRLLTPFELLSHFHLVDHSNLLVENMGNMRKGTISNANDGEEIYASRQSDNKLLPTEYPNSKI
jgi:hypothetical protein